MVLELKPFVPIRLDEEKQQDKGRTIGVWFNDKELADLEEYGVFLHQEKQATVIKQMVVLGAKLIDDDKIRAFRHILFNNVRKNKRQGIEEVGPKFRKS